MLNDQTRVEFDSVEFKQKLAELIDDYLFPEGSKQERVGLFVTDEYQKEFECRFKAALLNLLQMSAQLYSLGRINEIIYPEEILWDIIFSEIQKQKEEIQTKILESV